MTEDSARRAYTAFCTSGGRAVAATTVVELPDGSWLFVEQAPDKPGQYEGVAVRPDGAVVEFGGALGKVLRARHADLGAPRSNERFLGATAVGRYQLFNSGVAIWEGREDIGYPILESLSPLRRQFCVVAFFDLRGFTAWSSEAPPNEVQQAILAFEASVHDGFPATPAPWKGLFLKGTGDGVMIVSQADWYDEDPLAALNERRMSELRRGHAVRFLRACERTVLAGRDRFAHYRFPLAIGCGIAAGELDRVFLFGRFDFIGPAANEAAKLQQHAWNEICVTRDFGGILNLEGHGLDAEWELAGKGWRLRLPS